MADTALLDLSAVELRRRIGAKEISPVELLGCPGLPPRRGDTSVEATPEWQAF